MIRYYILALLMLAAMTAFAQEGSGLNLAAIDKQVIPEDTAVRKGVLANGLTYYICRNDKPSKQAFFYLLVKAGSIVEQDHERGIAHFVEHMLFKGTKHFPGSVIDFFRRNGLQFGHDTNAFTGFTTVRYQLNAIPIDNTLLMDYKKRENTAHSYGWLCCIPMPSAIKYMAEDLGLEYVIC